MSQTSRSKVILHGGVNDYITSKFQSARGLAHSGTLARLRKRSDVAERRGVRRPSAAFLHSFDIPADIYMPRALCYDCVHGTQI